MKDAFGETDIMAADVRALVEERLPESMREPIHPACAKKLIEGAVAYAEKLGFAPHRDFRKARRVLSGLDASLCPTEFVCGRDGRPCFVRGPHDSEERINRVLAILRARVGPDGYDYDPVMEDEEGDDLLTLREDLMHWLDAEDPPVPRFHEFSGMVTALHICPGLVMPTKLMEVMWGKEGRGWTDEAEAKDFVAMLMEYWNYAGDLLHDAIAPDAAPGEQPVDVWQEDFPEGDSQHFIAATKDWAIGFLRTTELWPEAWGDATTRPDLAEHWELIGWWVQLEQPGNLKRIAAAAERTPSHILPKSVVALARALRPAAAEPPAG